MVQSELRLIEVRGHFARLSAVVIGHWSRSIEFLLIYRSFNHEQYSAAKHDVSAWMAKTNNMNLGIELKKT